MTTYELGEDRRVYADGVAVSVPLPEDPHHPGCVAPGCVVVLEAEPGHLGTYAYLHHGCPTSAARDLTANYTTVGWHAIRYLPSGGCPLCDAAALAPCTSTCPGCTTTTTPQGAPA